jgi:DNA processing protein
MTGTEACIALNMVPNLGPVRLRKLIEVFETPERVLRATASELRRVDGVGPEVADGIAGWESQIDLAGELRRIEEFGAHVLTRESAEYPARSARDLQSADCSLRLGNAHRTRPSRGQRRRLAQDQSLRARLREEAFLPARLRRPHRG